ncbi:MAG: type II toxin-antitoxin system RelE/ParE family toxin [Nitrospiria bacterium]
MKLRYTDKARMDVERAFIWYEKQRRGLGFEWLDCLEAAIQGILRFPKMYPQTHVKFRRSLVRRFPFSIFYTIEKDEIVVHGVFDNRQDPARRPQ